MRPILYTLLLILTGFVTSCGAQPNGPSMIALLEKTIQGTEPLNDVALGTQVTQSAMETVSPDDLRRITALSVKLFEDKRKTAKQMAGYVLICVNLRHAYDSAVYIEPHLDRLEQLAEDPSSGFRAMLLGIMGYQSPKVPARTLAYMATNLIKKDNDSDSEAVLIATLLNSRSVEYTKSVLDWAKSASVSAQNVVLQQLGYRSIVNGDVLEFIHWALNHLEEKRPVINAVSRLPMSDRLSFNNQLAQIAVDPKETAENRQAAQDELKMKLR